MFIMPSFHLMLGSNLQRKTGLYLFQKENTCKLTEHRFTPQKPSVIKQKRASNTEPRIYEACEIELDDKCKIKTLH